MFLPAVDLNRPVRFVELAEIVPYFPSHPGIVLIVSPCYPWNIKTFITTGMPNSLPL
jgi:hypothetical protein